MKNIRNLWIDLDVTHLCCVNGIDYTVRNYEDLCHHFMLQSLQVRRKEADFYLFHKILHGKVNCPALLSSIHFNLPLRRTRHTKAFGVKKSRLKVCKNDFLPRTVVNINALDCIDFFDRGLTKRDISSALSL